MLRQKKESFKYWLNFWVKLSFKVTLKVINITNTHTHTHTHTHSHTVVSLKALPFAAEVQSSGQAYNQQTHTENGHNYLLLSHWLNDELRVATPGAVVAPLTPAAQRDASFVTTQDDDKQQTLTHTHTRTHRLILAVLFIDVHQQHALSVVEAVLVKRAVAVLRRPLHHMRARFSLTWSAEKKAAVRKNLFTGKPGSIFLPSGSLLRDQSTFVQLPDSLSRRKKQPDAVTVLFHSLVVLYVHSL